MLTQMIAFFEFLLFTPIAFHSSKNSANRSLCDSEKLVSFVKSEIKKYAAAGKSIYPMLRALNYTQPQLLAAKKPTKEEMEKRKAAEARNG